MNASTEALHYTTVGGLYGILTSKVLWATHTDFLNDNEEREWFFKHRLKHLLQRDIPAQNEELKKLLKGTKFEQSLLTNLPAVEDQRLSELCNALRNEIRPLNEIYVTSLCHGSDNDGLLSQWRGYGVDGGYAIVFDLPKLVSFFKASQEAYDFLEVEDVIYHQGGEYISNLSEQCKTYESAIVNSFVRREVPGMPTPYKSFAMLSALFKHNGFHEEREIRVVAVPVTNSSTTFEAGKHIPPRQEVKFRQQGGILIPYIEIRFSEKNSKDIPIKRIIVGPHPDAERRKRSVEILVKQLDLEIDVVDSKTPYRG